MTGADGPLARVLHQVVDRYGPGVLDDSAALRSALGTCRPDLARDDVEALVAGAGSSAVAGLLDARRRGTAPHTALQEAVRTVRSRTGLDDPEARAVGEALGYALGVLDDPEITWGDGAVAVPRPLPPAARASAPRPRRRAVGPVAAGLALLIAASLAVVSLLDRGSGPPPDPYAVAQVAGRFRALGASLLEGAQRCAPLAPAPGELERVSCGFEGWAMTLVGYDTPTRLRDARTDALTADPTSVRSARAADGTTAFALDETRSATSTVYWDTQTPRPLSAEVSTAALTLPELVAFFDARHAAVVARPEVPGPAFSSGELWELARTMTDEPGAQCEPTPTANRLEYLSDEVTCRYPNGVAALFARAENAERFARYRAAYASDVGSVPGTHSVGGLTLVGGGGVGQVAVSVLASTGDVELYYDRGEGTCFALLDHPDFTTEQLQAFWSAAVQV